MSEANAGKDTIFAFQTMGKGVFWSEIAKGKKVGSIVSERPFSSH
jgi:hypothetical protein